MEEQKGVGKAVREIRRERGMSRRKLSERIDASESWLVKLEAGNIPNPSFFRILDILGVLNVSPNKFVERTGHRPRNTRY